VDNGRVAYEAYGVVVGHRNYAGDPMPAWDDLPEVIRRAWQAAAAAVLEHQGEGERL